MMGASATSSVPASAALICFTTTRPAEPPAAAVSCAPAFGRSTGVNTLGRSEITAGVPVILSFSKALPAYTGRVTVTAPPTTPKSVTSWASGRPSRAAGRRSLPHATLCAARRRAAPAPRGRCSQDLGFLAQQAYQLRNGRRTFAHDLSFLTLGRRREREQLEPTAAERYGLHLQGLL